jgi:hypothetical protein
MLFTMPDSLIVKLPTPLAVVCHDAGSANIIFSWLESAIELDPDTANFIKIFALGPSKKLLDSFDIGAVQRSSSIEEAVRDVTAVLTGTGWETSTELQALTLANKKGLRAIAVIDHWVNYRKRFCIDGIHVDPKEIWVTDLYAKIIAEKKFPMAEVVLQVNCYLMRAVEKIKSIPKYDHEMKRVLYVLEPIREIWCIGSESGEFDALNYFLSHLNDLSIGSIGEIRLRPHPSDPPNKYNRWLVRDELPNLILDASASIESSIAWADVVVGCQSMAMVVALKAAKRVISSLPPWAPLCSLPHAGIEMMAKHLQIKHAKS